MEKKRLFEDNWNQCSEEAKMAKMQLKNIQANVTQLLAKIEACEELDAWVQSYLTKADDYLDSVKKYVVFGQDDEETVIEPIPVTGDEGGDEGQPEIEPETALPGAEPLMPPIDGYDPDAEATDLTGGGVPGEEPIDLMGEPGEDTGEDTGDDIEGEEIEDIEGEEGEEIEDIEGEEGEEIEPMDNDDIEMPSMADFQVGGGEAVATGDVQMPKPDPEDELSFDDLDFFQTQEFANPEEEEKMDGEFDEVEGEGEEEIEEMPPIKKGK